MYIFLAFASEDEVFAHQLAVQLQQRGLVVWPFPNTNMPGFAPLADPAAALQAARHVVIVLSKMSAAAPAEVCDCEQIVGDPDKHIFLVLRETCDVPDVFQTFPVVDFRERFLMAIEDLVKLLKSTGAPTRPLTVEHPPPVVKVGLLPHMLPSERCWRDDRLRIHYHLPMNPVVEELAIRMPEFFAQARFDPVKSEPPALSARRQRGFALFDPRRAQHTLTIEPLEGALRVYYQMTRTQVYYWFPAHYRVLDREAAALYRYLATGKLENSLQPVQVQSRIARTMSWASVLIILLVIGLLLALILDELGVNVI